MRRLNSDNKKVLEHSKWVLGRLPTFPLTDMPYERGDMAISRRMNRYLKFQSRRIERLVEEGNLRGAFLVWTILAKNSKSYQISLFNKVKKDWYRTMDRFKALEELIAGMNHLRSWNLRSLLKRSYIQKNNGKLRPIGAPNIKTKMLHRYLADCISYLSESKRRKTNSNHAFRKNMGINTAIKKLIKDYELHKEPMIYKFDLKAFFNKVPWAWIWKYINNNIDPDLAKLVITVLKHCNYEFKEIQDEWELKIIDEEQHGKNLLPVIMRLGTPQGSPMSPILSTLVLELKEIPKEITMYADDGVYIGENFLPTMKWLSDLGSIGIITEPEKCKVIHEGKLNFLGIDINFINKTLYRSDLGWLNYDKCSDLEIDKYLRACNNRYSEKLAKEEPWNWKIQDNSMLVHIRKSLIDRPKQFIQTHYRGIKSLPFKGHMYIQNYGTFNYIQASSESMQFLVRHIHQGVSSRNLKHIRRLKFPDFQNTKFPLRRKNYIEISPVPWSSSIMSRYPI